MYVRYSLIQTIKLYHCAQYLQTNVCIPLGFEISSTCTCNLILMNDILRMNSRFGIRYMYGNLKLEWKTPEIEIRMLCLLKKIFQPPSPSVSGSHFGYFSRVLFRLHPHCFDNYDIWMFKTVVWLHMPVNGGELYVTWQLFKMAAMQIAMHIHVHKINKSIDIVVQCFSSNSECLQNLPLLGQFACWNYEGWNLWLFNPI